MKKLLSLSIILIAFIWFVVSTTPTELQGADDYLLTTGTKRDSTFVQRGDQHYTLIKFDTATIYQGVDTTVDLGALYYNFWIRSLNAPGNSTFVKVAFSAHKGIWHDDSVARNMDWATVGEESADDYFIAPIGSRYIYFRPTKGDSSGDTTVTVEVKAVR